VYDSQATEQCGNYLTTRIVSTPGTQLLPASPIYLSARLYEKTRLCYVRNVYRCIVLVDAEMQCETQHTARVPGRAEEDHNCNDLLQRPVFVMLIAGLSTADLHLPLMLS